MAPLVLPNDDAVVIDPTMLFTSKERQIYLGLARQLNCTPYEAAIKILGLCYVLDKDARKPRVLREMGELLIKEYRQFN